MFTPLHIAAIRAYPVKSLRGHDLPDAVVDARGIAGDRRWLVVDARGRFVTRRERPQMALVDVRCVDGGIVLSHPYHGRCLVAIPPGDAQVVEGTIWRDTLPLRLASDEAASFLTAVLGSPVRLVHQPDDSRRMIVTPYGRPDDHVSLADGFPLLLTGEGSLAAVNASLPQSVTMARFRPNLVVAGAEPWEEDEWRRIRIGGVVLRIARPCSRCIVVTQAPDTGERHDGNEPLTTLRRMGRATREGIMFGQNAIPETFGQVSVGDPIEVLERGSRPR